MSEEKQIEEMENIYYKAMLKARDTLGSMNEGAPRWYAKAFYAAGCRKQSEGEWLQGVNNSKVCSICGKEPLYTASGTTFATTFYRVKSNYCPNCGAKMKGEK